MKKSAQDLVSI